MYSTELNRGESLKIIYNNIVSCFPDRFADEGGEEEKIEFLGASLHRLANFETPASFDEEAVVEHFVTILYILSGVFEGDLDFFFGISYSRRRRCRTNVFAR